MHLGLLGGRVEVGRLEYHQPIGQCRVDVRLLVVTVLVVSHVGVEHAFEVRKVGVSRDDYLQDVCEDLL